MRKQKLCVGLTFSGLLALAGCQSEDNPMMASADQTVGSSSDMMTAPADAADPNAPGLVRYSYVCGTMPEKSVELPHVRFGATYNCRFMSDYFAITVTDDRVPVKVSIGVPNYHGPGTYTIIAYDYILAGIPVCRWPSFEVSDKNCPLLVNDFSRCCNTMELRAQALTCTVVVQQHTLTRVTGTFECHIQTAKEPPGTTDYCPLSSTAKVRGSFDFGPQDCL